MLYISDNMYKLPIIRYRTPILSMRNNILKNFDRIPYFTTTSFKQLIGADEAKSQLVRETLSRWEKAEYIIRLKKGFYMTRRFYDGHRGDMAFSQAVSAILNPQSYISLEYLLQRSGVLADVTYPITAVTLKNTRKYENVIGTYIYRHIKLSLYTGFTQENYHGVIYSRASVSKALFDYFYFRPLPRHLRKHKISLAAEFRLNVEELPSDQKDEFVEFVVKSDSGKMAFVLDNLRRTAWQP